MNQERIKIVTIEKVYITKSKVHLLTNSMQIDESKINNIYIKDLNRILSIPERKQLALYREIINQDEFILSAYKPQVRKDTKHYVYESVSKPSYHKDKNCISLNSNFENYEIPVEIQELGKNQLEYDVIEEYRTFFKLQEDLYKKDHTAFLALVGVKFNVHIKNIKEVNYSNSGLEEVEIISSGKLIEKIEQDIEEILSKMENFRNLDEYHKKEISRLGFGSHKVIKQTNDKDSIIYKWHEYKKELKRLIEEYFRIKLNPDFEFSRSMLDSMGFKPCYHCCK